MTYEELKAYLENLVYFRYDEFYNLSAEDRHKLTQEINNISILVTTIASQLYFIPAHK